MFKCAYHGQKFSVSLKYRFWKNKWEQWNQLEGSLKHLKKSAPEVKCSWSDDVIRSKFIRGTSSEARSPEVEVHQKMRELKLQRLFSTSSIAEDQKSEATVNSNKFEGIGCLFFEERWQSTIVRNVQPLSPLLSLCLCCRTRITALPAKMFLQNLNGFEIDPSQNNNQIRQKIIGDWSKLQTTLFDVLAISQRLFHTSI